MPRASSGRKSAQILAGKLVILAVVSSQAGMFGSSLVPAAGPYNVFVLNNFSASSSDVQGGLAAGGNINITSYSVGSNLSAGDISSFPSGYTLVAGGSLTAGPGTLFFGNAFGNTTSLTSFTLNDGSLTTGGTSPVDFGAATTQLDSLSTTLAGMSGTPGDSCALVATTVTCNAAADGLNIINVADPSIFDGNSINITSSGSNVTLVINVPGASDTFGGGGFTAFLNGTTVLFNYYQATNIQLGDTGYTASLLAPLATVLADSGGQFNGTFVAASFGGGQIEFHNTDTFTPQFVNPEPGSLSLAAIGGGLMMFVGMFLARRARRRTVPPVT